MNFLITNSLSDLVSTKFEKRNFLEVFEISHRKSNLFILHCIYDTCNALYSEIFIPCKRTKNFKKEQFLEYFLWRMKVMANQTKWSKHIYIYRYINQRSIDVQIITFNEILLRQGFFFVSGPKTDKRKCSMTTKIVILVDLRNCFQCLSG